MMASKRFFIIFLVISLLSHVFAFPSRNLHSWDTIKKLSLKGPYLGIVTVYPAEEDAFFAFGAFKPDPENPYLHLSGRVFRIGKVEGTKVIYVRCGVGLVNAAAVTQQLVDIFDIIGVLHFGISGNVNSSLSIGDVIIPKQIAQIGLWDWLKPKASVPTNDVADMEFGSYNLPNGGYNQLGSIGYRTEEFYSVSGKENTPQRILRFQISKHWLELAFKLEGIKLHRCVNSSVCLSETPKIIIGLDGATANVFVDNAAYGQFVFTTFGVSSVDMESAAVVMTCLSNGFPVIVIRGLSDLAGATDDDNSSESFVSLAASNAVKTVVQFVKILQVDHLRMII